MAVAIGAMLTVTPPLSSKGVAQTVSQSDHLFDPFPSRVRQSLENFLAHISAFKEAQKGDRQKEYEALTGTLTSFLAADHFEQAILDARRDQRPIELTYFKPQPLKEAKMIHDFSQEFLLPLHYETSQEIAPFSVVISLVHPSKGLSIKVSSAVGESVYLIED